MVRAEQRAVTNLNTFLPHKAALEIKMLILASGSPRRKELLGGLSLNFRAVVSDIDESMTEPLAPEEYVRALAEKKARACTGSCSVDDYIISADTIVCKRGVIYGKPAGREEAYEMLREFSGGIHQVYTGFAVTHMEKVYSESVCTDVVFRELTDNEIYDYIDREKPYDKAGAYGIQEGAGIFVQRINGSYDNVVGLPVCALEEAFLREFGISLSSFRKSADC